jgi:dGTP triphosphohydrolase
MVQETEPAGKRMARPSEGRFELFEGNAQGFRVLTQLQNAHNPDSSYAALHWQLSRNILGILPAANP